MFKNEDRKKTYSRERPLIPKLNLDIEYLELKAQERDLKDMEMHLLEDLPQEGTGE